MNALLGLLSGLIGLLPEPALGPLARVGGALWFDGLRYRRQVILANLATAFPELEAAARERLGRAACVHLCLTLLEFLRIPRYRRRGLERVVRVEGSEHWEAALAQGKGVLCLSGHLGSFELAVAAVAGRGAPVSLVVKRFPPGVDAFVNGLRRGSGLGVIYAEGALRPVLSALRDNGSVVFVLDQNATRRIGVFVDFFGKPACTMSGLALLALRSGAPVIAATPFRAADGTHVLRIHPPIPLEAKDSREATLAHMTARYTQVIEAAIREHPEQWFWTHKRWRTRPVSTPAPGSAGETAGSARPPPG